jgi:hypothetical protein
LSEEVESETYEFKSRVEWSRAGKQFDVLKTIVAFANCHGGVIEIAEYTGDEKHLDSARLDDFVSKYVEPSVRGISSSKTTTGVWKIRVEKSPYSPHVISNTGNYHVKGRDRAAFYPGQIYVRHSSKSEPAGAADMQRMIREGISSWLSSLGEAVAKVGLSESDNDVGIPMRLIDGGPAVSVSFDESHPYSASDLGKPFRKTGAWIGKLINVEGMRYDPRYTRSINVYSKPISCFSQAAKDRVKEILEENPDYNPYRA